MFGRHHKNILMKTGIDGARKMHHSSKIAHSRIDAAMRAAIHGRAYKKKPIYARY